MWFNFDVKNIDGHLLPHPSQVLISDTCDVTFKYNVQLDLAPEGFWKLVNPTDKPEDKNVWIPMLTIYEGWQNLPSFEFVEELYGTEKFPFSVFNTDVLNNTIESVKRRDKISKRLVGNLAPTTEFKKIRKVVMAIIKVLPELKDVPDVLEFIEYCDTVENTIGKFPKK